MVKRKDKELSESFNEIRALERTRAVELRDNKATKKFIEEFREQYIVRGFLMPLYSFGSSSFQTRIGSFDKYILSWKDYGQRLSNKKQGWIRSEDFVFWRYLIDGQEILGVNSKSEGFMKIDGYPADAVWREISDITRTLGLFGEAGGGIFVIPDHLSNDDMKTADEREEWNDDEGGWLYRYTIPGAPHWISLFWRYQQYVSRSRLETRPAWFHLLNYALYNIPIKNISVFCVTCTGDRKIERVQFLDERLSQQARAIVSNAFHEGIIKFNEQDDRESADKLRSDMIYWLWFNVGHPDSKAPLSYGQIGEREDMPRQTVQSAVRRIDHKLKKQMNGGLLWLLLDTGEEIGLNPNMVYQSLVKKGYVPEKEIDGFSRVEGIKVIKVIH